MKALIKGGLFLALGWLAHSAPAQDTAFRPIAVTNPIPGDGGIRTVSVGQPTRLDGSSDAITPSFRPISGTVVRGQAPDDKTVPLPNLVIGGNDKTPAKALPKEKGFQPPPPTPMPAPMPVQIEPTPSPIFDSLGILQGDDCCGDVCNDVCGMRHRRAKWGGIWGNSCCPDRAAWWVNAEMLMWWQKSMAVPPLLTGSPAGQIDNVGVLGDPRTMIFYDSVPNRTRGGARFTAGMWLPHFCNVGLEVRYFFLTAQRTSATFQSDGNPQFARPFFDVEQQVNASEFASPGQVTIQTSTQLWGIDGLVRHKLHCGPRYWVDLLWGYKHLNLSESLEITEDTQFATPIGQVRIIETESFRTRNQFNGLSLGFEGECRVGTRCFVGLRATMAMGTSHQIVNIDGNTAFFLPAPFGSSGAPGALLASPTNMGQVTANRFAILPEVGFKFGVDLTDHLRIYAGYDFLYLNSTLRPGDQIDTSVAQSYRPFVDPNTGQARPGIGGTLPRPTPPYRTSDFWAQGFNFGLQYRY